MGLVTEVDSGLHQFDHRDVRAEIRASSGVDCFGGCGAGLCDVCGRGDSGFG
jgi:hypothetical protein